MPITLFQRRFAVVIVVLIVAPLFAACGANAPIAASVTSEAAPVSEQPEPSVQLEAPPAPATPPAQTDAASANTPNPPLALAGPVLQTAGYNLVAAYPHDPAAYTQGLVYAGDGVFYEGTGLKGRSTLRKVELATGAVDALHALDANYFGEGIAVVGERIFQLTWQDCVGFVYERATLKPLSSFAMPTDPRSGLCLEGWGLTFDGEQLLLSDGSERIFFVDPVATEQSGQLAITGEPLVVLDNGSPVYNLNELEYVRGELYANIWRSDLLVRIDLQTGQVLGYVDLSGLRASMPESEWGSEIPEVLNGIAYDAVGDRLFVTGKLWPRLFEIELLGAFTWFVSLPLLKR